MSDEVITKRLHVSGLTPAITVSDLSRRLGSFGNVKTLDGFGQLDALGQPRKFGYVTIEGTKGQLAKCVNVLSGSTWKGTKLRIGDAKPDYRERIQKELDIELGPPKKKRKSFAGTHAEDMSLVDPSNVSFRPGWTVTTMGRIVRPVKMRPEKPLSPQVHSTRPNTKGKDGKEKKKRVRDPDSRARRRVIDPTRWDSAHLKGMWLDVITAPKEKDTVDEVMADGSASDDESVSSDGSSSISDSDASSIVDVALPPKPVQTSIPTKAPKATRTPTEETILSKPIVSTPSHSPPLVITRPSTTLPLPSSTTDLRAEAATSLSLLHSLFADEDQDWDGRESMGSDIDEQDIARLKREGLRLGNMELGGEDFEVVPMEVDAPTRANPARSEMESDDSMEEVDKSLPLQSESTSAPPTPTTPQSPVPQEKGKPPVQMTKLKDLFAPREEEGGFSLLGHLDLDLELDDELDIPSFAEATAPVPVPVAEDQPSITQAATHPVPIKPSQPQFTFDPSLPLFFPIPSSQTHLFPRQKDIATLARENIISAGFYRTESEDEIRKRWEEQKGELTREWKRRFREAGKMRRRRGGGDGDS